MKQLHEGWDYKLYQIYIWGGLLLNVIYIVLAVLIFDIPNLAGSMAILAIMGPFFVWFTGFLLYWWWVFLFKGNKELKELSQTPSAGIPDINSLKSWNTLHQAMSVSGGSVDELIKNAKKANRPMILWFGCQNFLALWVCGFITLGSLGFIAASKFPIMVIGVVIWVVLMIVGTPFLLGWGARSSEKAYLAPLGLTITRMPGLAPDVISMLGGGQILIPDGPAIVEGERYGRLVHIETTDNYSLTILQAELPKFKVLNKDGKLTPAENAPENVIDVLKGLRKAKRWQGIEVYAGSDGIAIQRKSKGTNMWLYDLWLAEYLLDKINTSQT